MLFRSGSDCSSLRYPGSHFNVIGTGSTNVRDAISEWSSRGPSSFGGQKPDVSAPGEDIRSAFIESDTSYIEYSGTSMSAPHVAGLVALLRSANPNIRYATVKQILQNNADRNLQLSGQTCGGISDTVFPNYQFGHGRINALRSVNALRAKA